MAHIRLLAPLVIVFLAACGSRTETPVIDRDGDGVPADEDCNDLSSLAFPGAEEIPYDGVDNDCDGADLTDMDGDGEPAEEAGGKDCDDGDPGVAPGALDVCDDGVDQDCSGSDQACSLLDVDEDGFTPADGDCEDADPDVNPAAEEEPYNGKDDDCLARTRDDDLDADGFARDAECDDRDRAIHPDARDVPYDGIDQDCSGADLVDVDGDGAAAAEVGGPDCDDDDPTIGPDRAETPYNAIDDDCDPSTPDDDLDGDGRVLLLDCDDENADRYPGNPEIPYDGVDQNCNGEDLTDIDFDGHDAIPAGGDDCDDGDRTVNPAADERPYNGKDDDCAPETPDDDLDSDGAILASDCDDEDAARFEGNPEVAYDGVDQDCSGLDLTDVDGDGHDAVVVSGDDCDDGDATIHAGAPEIFGDGIDQDCEGHDAIDSDGDEHASVETGGDDCDDGNATVHPGQEEVCDNADDEDCSGSLIDCLHAWEGVKNDVAVDDLDGWTLCYSDAYADSGETLPPAACTGKYLLLACRETDADTLLVAAHAEAEDVLKDTGSVYPNAGTTTTSANGVEWYFHVESEGDDADYGSWGFAPEDGDVYLYTCDQYEAVNAQAYTEERICWHTRAGTLAQGWRCGATTALNASTDYERLVYHSDKEPRATR